MSFRCRCDTELSGLKDNEWASLHIGISDIATSYDIYSKQHYCLEPTSNSWGQHWWRRLTSPSTVPAGGQPLSLVPSLYPRGKSLNKIIVSKHCMLTQEFFFLIFLLRNWVALGMFYNMYLPPPTRSTPV